MLSTCAALNMEGATQGDAGREWREKLRDEEDKQELNCGWDVRHLEDRVVEKRSQMEDSFGEEAKFVEECHKGSPSRDYHNCRESCLEQDWPECCWSESGGGNKRRKSRKKAMPWNSGGTGEGRWRSDAKRWSRLADACQEAFRITKEGWRGWNAALTKGRLEVNSPLTGHDSNMTLDLHTLGETLANTSSRRTSFCSQASLTMHRQLQGSGCLASHCVKRVMLARASIAQKEKTQHTPHSTAQGET